METDSEPHDVDLKNLLVHLPWDVVRDVMYYLPNSYIRDVFLRVPELRESIVEEFFPELQFDLGLTFDRKLPPINEIKGISEVADFLGANPDVVPQAAYISAESLGTLKEVLTEFKDQLLQIPRLHIRIGLNETRKKSFLLRHSKRGGPQTQDLSFLQAFTNLRSLKLENSSSLLFHETFGPASTILNALPNLESLAFKDYLIGDWSQVVLPERLRKLQVEERDIASITFPSKLEKIYWTYGDLRDLKFSKIPFPASLTTLVIKYCKIPELCVSDLPRSLEHLELYNCAIERILLTDEGEQWPPGLVTLRLGKNKLTDECLKQVSLSKLPESLRVLDLEGNEFTRLYYLNSLPRGLKVLNISANWFKSLADPTNDDGSYFYKFPDTLEKLVLSHCYLVDREYAGFVGKLHLPDTLLELVMDTILDFRWMHFVFPESLKKLTIKDTNITDLLDYEIEGATTWSKLENLETLDLRRNRIETLANWRPPPNLHTLDLFGNNLSLLSSSWPLFNQNFNVSLRNLRYLDLSYNHISLIEDEVCLPPNLEELRLERHKLQTFKFTDGILNSRQLQHLSFFVGNLKRIEVATNKKASLRRLDLGSRGGGAGLSMTPEELDYVFNKLGLKHCDEIFDSARNLYHLEPTDIAWEPRKVSVIQSHFDPDMPITFEKLFLF